MAGEILDLSAPLDLRLIERIRSRDGVYLYLLTEDSKLAISHRVPVWKGVDPETEPFLATHRALFRLLSERYTKPVKIRVGGEFRVLLGRTIRLTNRAGSFYDKLSAQLRSRRAQSKGAERKLVSEVLAEVDRIEKLSSKTRQKALDELLSEPRKQSLFTSALAEVDALGRERLQAAETALRQVGLVTDKTEITPAGLLSPDSHREAEKSAQFEIWCLNDSACRHRIQVLTAAYRTLASGFDGQQVRDTLRALDASGVGEKAEDLDEASTFYEVLTFVSLTHSDGLLDAASMCSGGGQPERLMQLVEDFWRLLEQMGVGEPED